MIDEFLPAPLIADRYELQALIGRGGAGSVYRALDRRLDRVVAVKVLRSDPDGSELLRRRSEARLLASLSHPALVTLYDTITTPDATYLVMEHLGGGTLQGRIRRGALAADAVAAVAADVADALAHIHRRGIVHRDVKPGNVLLAEADHEGRPPIAKLSDFGIAKLLETSPGTTTGVLGTAHYLSPEQARGVAVGPPSDVYSLGLTLLEAATGRPAFPGTAVESLTARLLRDPEVPGGLGYGWRSLLTAMTAREPGDRPTASDVAFRARALAGEPGDGWAAADITAPLVLPMVTAPPRTEALPSPMTVMPRPRARRLAIAAGALAMVVGTVIALLLTVHGTPSAGGPARAGTSASAPPTPLAAAPPTSAPEPSTAVVHTVAPSSAAASGGGAGTDSSSASSASATKATSSGKAKPAKAKQKGKSGSSGTGASKSAVSRGGKAKHG